MIRPELPAAVATAGPVALAAEREAGVTARLERSDLFQEFRRAFEATTGLPLALRTAGSFRTPLQGSPRLNPFCALMTQKNKTCAACLQLQQRLEDEATRTPQTRQCYAGLSESAVPLRVGGVVLGYLQTGQVFLRAPSQRQFQDLVRLAARGSKGPDAQKLQAAYFKTRVIHPRQYQATVRLLAIFADHLATISNQILLREAVTEPDTITRGRQYIAAHHRELLTLIDVARAVHLSPTYFCMLFKRCTGLSFTEYLRRARLESAKQILLNPQRRISEAAYAAGFQSLSQFNRVFHHVEGETPSVYRRRRDELDRTSDPGVGTRA